MLQLRGTTTTTHQEAGSGIRQNQNCPELKQPQSTFPAEQNTQQQTAGDKPSCGHHSMHADLTDMVLPLGYHGDGVHSWKRSRDLLAMSGLTAARHTCGAARPGLGAVSSRLSGGRL